MAVTDADRLAAAGAELTIAGHVLHVKYTPRSLKMIEDRFGSFDDLNEQLQQAGKSKGKLVSLTFAVLAMGLQHESVAGERITEDWLLDNGSLRDITLYADAYTAAFDEAFPEAAATVDPTTPLNGANGSTGRRTSGTRSRNSIGARRSSGTT